VGDEKFARAAQQAEMSSCREAEELFLTRPAEDLFVVDSGEVEMEVGGPTGHQCPISGRSTLRSTDERFRAGRRSFGGTDASA